MSSFPCTAEECKKMCQTAVYSRALQGASRIVKGYEDPSPCSIGRLGRAINMMLVAQLVERRIVSANVAGSCPVLHPIKENYSK